MAKRDESEERATNGMTLGDAVEILAEVYVDGDDALEELDYDIGDLAAEPIDKQAVIRNVWLDREMFIWLRGALRKIIAVYDKRLAELLGPTGVARFGDYIAKTGFQKKIRVDTDELLHDVENVYDLAQLFRLGGDNFRVRAARAVAKERGLDPEHFIDTYCDIERDTKPSLIVIPLRSMTKKQAEMSDGEIKNV